MKEIKATITHDDHINAWYIKLNRKKIVKTLDNVLCAVNYDLDEKNNVVGIEIVLADLAGPCDVTRTK